jgi:pSer/pThr/pTyr-binding forkhead associated (FHA) protein
MGDTGGEDKDGDITQAIRIPEEFRNADRPVTPAMRVYLERIESGQVCQRIRIVKSRTVIGRKGARVDVELDDPLLSRRHAAIEVLGAMFFQVIDLASTNGTLVNDVRVDNLRRLNQGDVIAVGSTRLRLVVERDV